MSLIGRLAKYGLRHPKTSLMAAGVAGSFARTLFNRDRSIDSDYGVSGPESPLMGTAQGLGADIINQSGIMGIAGAVGFDIASSMYSGSALKDLKRYNKSIKSIKPATAVFTSYANGAPGPRLSRNSLISVKGLGRSKSMITGRYKKRSGNQLLKRLAGINDPQIASKASMALKLGKIGKFLGWSSLISAGFKMVSDGFQLPDPIRPYSPPPISSISGTFSDSQAAYTQRQRAIQSIQSSQYGGRSALGNEASFMHL